MFEFRINSFIVGLFLILVMSHLVSIKVDAQPCTPPSARAWLRVSDTGTGRDTLWFGFDSLGTYGLNIPLCESELPPVPPAGVFDARFVNIPGRVGWDTPLGLGVGFKYDYRAYVSRTHVDTHQVQFQPTVPPSYPMVFRWSPAMILMMCDSARLVDGITGTLLNARMHVVDSFRVTNTAFSFLLLIRYGQKSLPRALPTTPVLVAPPDGATAQPLQVTLRWRPSLYAERYHVQLGTDSNFVGGFVINDSTSIDTTRLASGLSYSTTYYWRVRALNVLGPSAFSTRWRFATQIQPPPAPNLSAPPNNQTNSPIAMTFIWGIASGATSYRLQIATTSSFTSGSFFFQDSTLATTSQPISGLLNNTQYWWRVRGQNAGGPGLDSPTWTFTTIIAAPPAPVLSSPPNGLIGVGVNPTLSWNAAATATSYRLQVARDTGFTVLVFNDSNITTISRQIGPLDPLTTYYWKVQGRNVGGWGIYAQRWSFTTQFVEPSAPTLSSPTNGQQNVPISVTLSWTGVPNALAYHVQLSTDSTFNTNLVVNDTNVTATSRNVGPLANLTRYFWRVATKIVGGWGQFSSPFNFTTIIAVPNAPTLVSPANGQTNLQLSVTFVWNPLSTANTYNLQVARDTAFGDKVLDDSTLTTTSRSLGGLTPGTNYFWRVRGKNIGGNGQFSTRWLFTTTATPPPPQLVSPLNSATAVPQSPVFIWSPSPTATFYRLQVATDSTFATATILFQDSTITDTTRQAGPFGFLSRLLWRVVGRNASGWGAPSSPRVFTVMARPTDPPTLSSPTHNAVNVNLDGPLCWQVVPGANSYQLQVARDTLMTNIFIDSTGIIDLCHYVRLAPLTPYFWRVRGINSEGYPGLWSGTRKLTTKSSVTLSPIPIFPADGDTGVTTWPTYRWRESPGASKYWIQLSTSTSFASPVRSDSSITTTSAILPPNLLPYTAYSWRARARNAIGWSVWSDTSRFTTGALVSVAPQPVPEIPTEFGLSQNYPNPFNPTTNFNYSVPPTAGRDLATGGQLPIDNWVSVKIYDVLGRELATLAEGEQRAGVHTITWNGQTGTGEPLSSGIYFARMVAVSGDGAKEVFSSTKKVLLMK